MRLAVVIPASNEEASIGEVVRRARAGGRDVIVVDDGSADRTAAQASAAGALVLRLRCNRGKGTALRQGIALALQRGADAVLTMDADGQHDPAEIPRFLEALHRMQADLVVGNRLSRRGQMPLIRWWTNRVMSSFLSRLSRQPIPDSQCGYRLIARRVLETCPLSTGRFEIETELVLEAARRGFRMVSIPIASIYRQQRSQIHPVRDTLRFIRFIWQHLRNRRDAGS